MYRLNNPVINTPLNPSRASLTGKGTIKPLIRGRLLWCLTFVLLLISAGYGQTSTFSRVFRDADTDAKLTGSTVYIVHTTTLDSLELTEGSGDYAGVYSRDSVAYGTYRIYVDTDLQPQTIYFGAQRQRNFIETVDTDGDNLIETAGLEDSLITAVKLATAVQDDIDNVSTAEIEDSSITPSKLSTAVQDDIDNVSTAEIEDSSITPSKLSTAVQDDIDNVVWSELESAVQDSIRVGSLDDGDVTWSKLSNDVQDSVQTVKLQVYNNIRTLGETELGEMWLEQDTTGNLIYIGRTVPRVYKLQGFSSTKIDSFDYPYTSPRGCTVDTLGNLHIVDDVEHHVYKFDGFSSTVLDSFDTDYLLWGTAWGTTCVQDKIYIVYNDSLRIGIYDLGYVGGNYGDSLDTKIACDDDAGGRPDSLFWLFSAPHSTSPIMAEGGLYTDPPDSGIGHYARSGGAWGDCWSEGFCNVAYYVEYTGLNIISVGYNVIWKDWISESIKIYKSEGEVPIGVLDSLDLPDSNFGGICWDNYLQRTDQLEADYIVKVRILNEIKAIRFED